MQKTILLTRGELGPKITRVLFFVLGISQVMQGIRQLDGIPLTTGDSIFGAFLSLTGLLLIVLGFALFNPAFKFCPRFSVDDERIVVREDIFYATKRIDWKDIKEIAFKSFALDILLKDGKEELLILRTNAEASIEVKKLVREMADRKMILIKGG